MALRRVGFLLSINEGETEWSSQVLCRGRSVYSSSTLLYTAAVCVHVGENEILFLSKLIKS